MASRRPRALNEGFAATVERIRARPPEPPETIRRGHRAFDSNTARLIRDPLSPPDAKALADDGAIVIFDECGCRGECGYEWFPSEDVKARAAATAPVISTDRKGDAQGGLAEWRDKHGRVIVEVWGDVRWGSLLPE